MDEAMLERTTSKLESALSRAPETLAAAEQLLEQQEPKSRKRAVIFIEDEKYRHDLTDLLSGKLEIETPDASEEALQAIDRRHPQIVIFDLSMPAMNGLEVVKRLRREASFEDCTIFVLTSNPEEDGQVAAAGATGYRASNAVTDLSRAVTSAVEARDWLSDTV
jgi:CheY-like chemotaxis protein